MEDLYIERWKQLLAHQSYPWAVFAHGTCVVLTEPESDLARQATDLIQQWPVHAGGNLGDFGVLPLTDAPGWVVTCAHPDILTYLAPEEVEEGASEIVLGLQGRAKRDQDAHEMRIIFVKDTK
ncbi:MAG TPA: hypothetical protein VHR15_04590 [Ktedonobacterales bacterium]|jgi:hypothetical protein|nr:hypothetical protein [Ktedonobacterales bacterium]